MEEKVFKYDLLGTELKVTVGKIAEQANGSCLVQLGDTVVMVNVTATKSPREGIDFFPLSCDFEEKSYAAGKIPGGFIKREGRPTEKAILTSRLIDRPLRPLFPEGYRNDVQVVATSLSVDEDNTPDVVAMIGSSIALSISDVPFNGPTAALNVGMIDGKIIINPNFEQRKISDLHLTVSGTKDAVMMVEAGSNKITEEQMLNAILTAHEEIKNICEFISEIQKEVGKEKAEYVVAKIDEELEREVFAFAEEDMKFAIRTEEKVERQDKMSAVEEKTLEHFSEIYPERESEIHEIIEKIIVKEVRRLILHESIRPDGRQLDEIRPLSCEVGILPRCHGSGLFKRGQTQVLTITTLGAPGDAQVLDGLIEEEDKRYIHHYNFPPYGVGEVKSLRSPGRREIGHGALAERALVPVLPSEKDFPYTIRLVSEVLSSNGSSSQASVCGSTLSLMDAGVPISEPVAGIAMGLIKNEGEDKVVILTDIQGLEDHFGDMDFKVAGTRDGITALQMDIKIQGIDRAILEEALAKAKKARLFILDKMVETISQPREKISKYAPVIIKTQVHPDKVRDIIGPGGKMINKIIDETGVSIDIDDDGKIVITAPNLEMGERAKTIINEIVKEVEVGETYLGKVTKIMNFGAFVEILNGKEGLIHISKISHERINKVEDVLKEGDEVLVKVIEIDSQGRVNLSRKDLLPKEEGDRKQNHEFKDRSSENKNNQ